MRRNFSLYVCEFVGTALMLFWGVTAVALLWGSDLPVPVIPDPMLRRFITGILFAAGATAVVYSPLGQRSGGHINPAVTLAFWRLGKFPGSAVPGYIVAQVLGALVGVAAAAVLWGDLARSVQYALTAPGEGWTWIGAMIGEALATFAFVFLIFICIDKPVLAGKTGFLAGFLVVVLVTIESPISGTSVNPARSMAPAILMPVFRDQWIYLVGPVSLLLDEPRSATVVALTDAQLRRITRESFGHVLAEDPARTHELLRQLACRLREASSRIAGGV